MSLTNVNKANFYSGNLADKIVHEDTQSYSVAGGGTTSTQTVTNPYGKSALITLRWSIDNSNYYPAMAYIDPDAYYTANGWCDANNIYLYMENYSAGTVTFYLHYVLDTVN